VTARNQKVKEMKEFLWSVHLLLRERLGSSALEALNYLWTAPDGELFSRAEQLISEI